MGRGHGQHLGPLATVPEQAVGTVLRRNVHTVSGPTDSREAGFAPPLWTNLWEKGAQAFTNLWISVHNSPAQLKRAL
ncbi:hypothetical protein SAT01_15450 [Sinomonas atrocyanea]|nr:hypothetical protein SAT01_15450 [Sinomonas atrocyanea]GGG67561.1 hypothetical protein GCM10007172_19220 [Sinomonas atrocyanea]